MKSLWCAVARRSRGVQIHSVFGELWEVHFLRAAQCAIYSNCHYHQPQKKGDAFDEFIVRGGCLPVKSLKIVLRFRTGCLIHFYSYSSRHAK